MGMKLHELAIPVPCEIKAGQLIVYTVKDEFIMTEIECRDKYVKQVNYFKETDILAILKNDHNTLTIFEGGAYTVVRNSDSLLIDIGRVNIEPFKEYRDVYYEVIGCRIYNGDIWTLYANDNSDIVYAFDELGKAPKSILLKKKELPRVLEFEYARAYVILNAQTIRNEIVLFSSEGKLEGGEYLEEVSRFI